MILNQHEIFQQNGIQHTHILKKYFLVTRAYGSEWQPSLIQYDGQFATDQNMLSTFL